MEIASQIQSACTQTPQTRWHREREWVMEEHFHCFSLCLFCTHASARKDAQRVFRIVFACAPYTCSHYCIYKNVIYSCYVHFLMLHSFFLFFFFLVHFISILHKIYILKISLYTWIVSFNFSIIYCLTKYCLISVFIYLFSNICNSFVYKPRY